MDTARFADDLRLIPDALDALADRMDAGLPGLDELPAASRVLVLGMGSSAYAAADPVRRARDRGFDAAVELASVTQLPEPADDLVVVAVSATGGSAEVLDAVAPYEGRGRLVAVTNREDSALAARADVVVPLLAGVEESGVACRTFRHTGPVLDEILNVWSPTAARDSAAIARRAAASSRAILAGASDWLDDVAEALRGPDGSWVLAPADRFASAQQSALMLREVPRRPAYACETGDWAHVDVYLTKTLDYRALVFAGSRWDEQAVEWMEQRGSRWIAVGGEVRGAELSVPLPNEDDPRVRLLTETLVAELIAERWRAEDPDFGWSRRVG